MNEHGVLRWFGRISLFGVHPFRYAAPPQPQQQQQQQQ
jgi:hypothetical protein